MLQGGTRCLGGGSGAIQQTPKEFCFDLGCKGILFLGIVHKLGISGKFKQFLVQIPILLVTWMFQGGRPARISQRLLYTMLEHQNMVWIQRPCNPCKLFTYIISGLCDLRTATVMWMGKPSVQSGRQEKITQWIVLRNHFWNWTGIAMTIIAYVLAWPPLAGEHLCVARSAVLENAMDDVHGGVTWPNHYF